MILKLLGKDLAMVFVKFDTDLIRFDSVKIGQGFGKVWVRIDCGLALVRTRVQALQERCQHHSGNNFRKTFQQSLDQVLVL